MWIHKIQIKKIIDSHEGEIFLTFKKNQNKTTVRAIIIYFWIKNALIINFKRKKELKAKIYSFFVYWLCDI